MAVGCVADFGGMPFRGAVVNGNVDTAGNNIFLLAIKPFSEGSGMYGNSNLGVT